MNTRLICITYIRKLDIHRSYLTDLIGTMIWNVREFKATTYKQIANILMHGCLTE